MKIAESLNKRLEERRAAGTYRQLAPDNTLIDFCSNDYLGFARSAVLKKRIDEELINSGLTFNGATGSRLLSGNSAYGESLEQEIAALHKSEAGLIFNSGYDANLGLFSSIPQRGDTIIHDELIHASIIDGARLSHASRYTFRHNDLQSLEDKLKHAKGNCYVAIESVYSMDGDTPPIENILQLTEKYNANLIVDEAHAVGLYDFGLINSLHFEQRVFARLVTFGKALGCHGAIVLGSGSLKNYLVNFARSFIYTTAAPPHQLASVKMAYQLLQESTVEVDALKHNIKLFKQQMSGRAESVLTDSESAIQCVVLGNNKAKETANELQKAGLDVRPILSPTVPPGSERIRVCLHSFNTKDEINLLTNTINQLIHA